jgi:signal transduction histidine kinase
MIVLLRSEATRYAISVRTALDADLPHVMGDRVQLQQVLMNLIMNSIDAMKAVEGTRDLAITSQRGGCTSCSPENGRIGSEAARSASSSARSWIRCRYLRALASTPATFDDG